MSDTVSNAIKISKDKLSKTFFRIVKNGDSYSIIEYSGLMKSSKTMMFNGWNRHEYLKKYITEDYPIFNVNDFVSFDGIVIEKKTKEELLKSEIIKFIEYYKLNQNLFIKMKEFKTFVLSFCNENFLVFNKFSNYKEAIDNKICQLNIPATEKIKYQSTLIYLINDIYLELDKLKIERSRLFFEDNFKFFLTLIKD